MAYSDEVLADSPRAYYRMDEASGLIQDSSGLAHHASASVGTGATYHQPTALSTDPSGWSIRIAAGDFSVPDHADLDLGDTLTAEAWINHETGDGTNTRAISGRGSLALTWGVDGSTQKLFIAKADTAVICLSTTNIEPGRFYHVVYTKSGATNRIYINGVDRTGTVTNQTFADVAVPLKIGSDYNDTLQWLGLLDEVAFYSTALSPERIRAHYVAGVGTFLPHFDPKFVYIRKNK